MRVSRHRVLVLDLKLRGQLKLDSRAQHAFFRGALTLFYSRVNGLVARKPVQEAYQEKGEPIPQLHQDLIEQYKDIDVLVFDNVDEAQFQGVELAGLVPIESTWSIFGNVALIRGEVLTINGVAPDPSKPWEARTRREPPLNGIIGVQWEPANTPYWGNVLCTWCNRTETLEQKRHP